MRIWLEFGPRGVRAGAARSDIVVIVDTLSFSTAVASALSHGAIVYPCREASEASVLATDLGIERSVRRAEAPAKGRFSLSPLTFDAATPGTRVALASPNGATCVRMAADGASAVLAGAPVNSRSVADAAADLAGRAGAGITVVACGERVPEVDSDGPLRFALEDYLGAGAVLSHLSGSLSPEADVCAAAWRACRGRLPDLLRECPSGVELREWGFEADVRYASQIDVLFVAPRFHDGAMISYDSIP